MARDQTRNVSFTAELNMLDPTVASGHDQNASEVVRAGLRLLQRQEQRNQRKEATLPLDQAGG